MSSMPSQADSAVPAFACPDHGDVLEEKTTALECAHGHRFAIVDGIPRFVGGSSYADHFGAQWNRYRTSQLDSRTGVPISADRARMALGADLWSILRGQRVLEIGCGAGRFTEVLLAQGAKVTSVDISSAVVANATNFAGNRDHRVVQADVRRLPFQPRKFDLVFCLGVVQHTPEPEQTIAALFAQVRPGGWLVFDHYRHNLSTHTKITEPLLRRVLCRVDTHAALRVTESLVRRLLPAHRVASRIPGAQQLLSRVSPVRSYYHAYPQLTEELLREWAMVDTHDALTSWYRHHRSPRSLRRTATSLGATSIHIDTSAAFAIVRAQRPDRVQGASRSGLHRHDSFGSPAGHAPPPLRS